MGPTKTLPARPSEAAQRFHRPPLGAEPVSRGLCVICDRLPDCSYVRARTTPVWSCDEFEPVTAAAISAAAHPPDKPAAAVTDRDAVEQQLGLCATCARAASCTYPRLAGGVWSCDEFE